MNTRTLFTSAIVLFFAQPTPAQVVQPVDTMNAALAGTLAICVGVIDGTFNLDNAAALAEFGFRPGSDADEDSVRQNNPGMELAIAETTDGKVLLGGRSRHFCIVEVQGATRTAVRDEMIRQLFETGARNEQHKADDGDLVRTFHFEAHTIEVQTGPDGAINFAVKPAS